MHVHSLSILMDVSHCLGYKSQNTKTATNTCICVSILMPNKSHFDEKEDEYNLYECSEFRHLDSTRLESVGQEFLLKG